MATLLKGAPAAQRLNSRTTEIVYRMREGGRVPTLAIVRVGNRADDLSYERSVIKRAGALGIEVRVSEFPADITESEFLKGLKAVNDDPAVNGILMFLPLPEQISAGRARAVISPDKDVDGCTLLSQAGIFAGEYTGFPPCTAEAVLKILDYYGIEVTGKNVVVLGRSMVIGRPVAMMLLERNATVTICHTRTVDTAGIARGADIIVACTGRMETIGKDYVAPGQVVIDVGTEWNEKKGKLCGDVIPEEVEPVVDAVTPVPGGVGAVTTAVLLYHVAEAADRQSR